MQYTVSQNGKPDYYEDRVRVGDAVKYDFDFAPWLEGKGTIASTVWTVIAGSIALNDTNQSALIQFNSAGSCVVTCLVTTTTGEKKKVMLKVAADKAQALDDYGMGNG